MALIRTKESQARIKSIVDTWQAAAELTGGTMPIYKAPLQDMRFVLHELHDSAGIAELPGSEDFSPELLDSVLEEAAKFTEEVLFPLNQSGDLEGCTYENGVVRTPKGFPEAYKSFCEGGWTAMASAPEFGGQGLPAAVSLLVEEMLCAANISFGLYPGLTHGAYLALYHHGDAAQKQTYLPNLVSGKWSGTMCLTEPHCGTDLGLLRTKAVPNGDGSFMLSGAKIFISAGEHDLAENIIHLVLARLPGAPAGGEGHFAVRRAEIPGEGRRFARRPQRRHLHRHRAQDGHQGLRHLLAQLRGGPRLAGRRAA